MNTFVIEDFDVHEDNECNFYTVAYLDSTSETEKFYDKYDDDQSPYFEDFQIIDAFLNYLSQNGTKTILRIRDEGKVNALPPERVVKECKIETIGNELRLYYFQVSPDVIILLGGGIAHDDKTGKPPIQFQEAQMFAKKISESIGVDFTIQEGNLIPENEQQPITIY